MSSCHQHLLIDEKYQKNIHTLHRVYQSSQYAQDFDIYSIPIELIPSPGYTWEPKFNKNGGLEMEIYPSANKTDLMELEKKINFYFPDLYRAYLLGPRCIAMEFEEWRMFPNLPSHGLKSIEWYMLHDAYHNLTKAGYIVIGDNFNFDLLCFNKDFQIVAFDHISIMHKEQMCDGKFVPHPHLIFCNVEELFQSFIEQCRQHPRENMV